MADEQRVNTLYAYWCAKEAVYKCHGEKEVSFQNDISLQPFNFAAEGHIRATLQKNTKRLNYTVNYLQYEDYMIGYVKGATSDEK